MNYEIINTSKGKFNVIAEGNIQNPVILILHGFPEDALSFEKIITSLVHEKYFVIAPDQRGYGVGPHSNQVTDYSISNLTSDVFEILKYYQVKDVILIGHDWGGIIAWNLIENYPEYFQKSIILNAPHPAVMKKLLKTNLNQILKSWYIYFFQVPYLSEYFLSVFNFKIFAKDIQSKTFLKKYDEENLKRIIEQLNVNKNFSYMINWYRAMKFYKHSKIFKTNQIPVNLIWGERDPYLSKELALKSKSIIENVELQILPNISHWPHHEMGHEFNHFILKMIK